MNVVDRGVTGPGVTAHADVAPGARARRRPPRSRRAALGDDVPRPGVGRLLARLQQRDHGTRQSSLAAARQPPPPRPGGRRARRRAPRRRDAHGSPVASTTGSARLGPHRDRRPARRPPHQPAGAGDPRPSPAPMASTTRCACRPRRRTSPGDRVQRVPQLDGVRERAARRPATSSQRQSRPVTGDRRAGRCRAPPAPRRTPRRRASRPRRRRARRARSSAARRNSTAPSR